MLNKSRVLIVLAVAILCVAVAIRGQTSASTMPNRSVTVSSGLPSVITTQTFRFDIPTTSVIGSIVFQYCSNSPLFALPCVSAGVDASAANLSSQSGNAGFTIDNADTTASKIVLTRAAAPGLITSNIYAFNNILNPSAAGTVYVRVSTHAALDGSDTEEDTGGVAYAVQQGAFNIGAFVPPFLQMCVGLTVAPDCSSTSGDSIDLGILSSTHANYAQSQFAVATNDLSGYSVYALGTTMTSGNNTIAALNTPRASFPGTPQFGINLRSNLIPPIGQNPVGVGTGIPTANYNHPNQFIFIPGDAIATSNLTTNYNRMTVSYLVNVPSNQPAGVYATTITYTATVSF